ncbi:MAG TPA: NAD-dependent epimerase/dehydratase family protein [Thermoleophilaceae bacterium]|jgi:nucleoside-diphosphate-sugar epimerase|nr:NAD-dependent epimerase/dehydratase family protein [Thermoleophilaceae bacterium]
MRAFVTGGTGFIGSRVVKRLRDRGDEVVALVRTPSKATDLLGEGVELVEGDLSDGDAIKRGVDGADGVFHIGAVYKVGIPKKEQPAMWDANVGGTERILDAAEAAGAQRIVYVSTGNVFGDTKGQVVDETYARNLDDGFLSYYDETKYRSHELVKERIERGAPIVVAQPGVVYGPGDHSEVGNMINQMRSGKLKMRMFPDARFNFVFVDDVADGIVLVYDKGQIGESYLLGGQVGSMDDLFTKVSERLGKKPPRMALPPAMARASAPLGPVIGPLMGFPPNMKELVKTSDVTITFRDDKARRELGYNGRNFDEGLDQTVTR